MAANNSRGGADYALCRRPINVRELRDFAAHEREDFSVGAAAATAAAAAAAMAAALCPYVCFDRMKEGGTVAFADGGAKRLSDFVVDYDSSLEFSLTLLLSVSLPDDFPLLPNASLSPLSSAALRGERPKQRKSTIFPRYFNQRSNA